MVKVVIIKIDSPHLTIASAGLS